MRMQNTKLFMASAESHSKDLLKWGCKYALISYYHAQKSKKLFGKKGYLRNYELVFCDSGAFSLRGSTLTIDEYWQYCESFAEWLRERSDDFDYAAEVDVDWQLFDKNGNSIPTRKGKLIVEEARKYIQEVSGVQILPVYHSGFDASRDLISDFRKMCKTSDFVCVGSGSTNIAEITQLYREAKRLGTRIHLFGLTSLELLGGIPCFSVDSTTWTMTGQTGKLFHFKNGKMRMWERYDSHRNKEVWRDAKELGIPFEGIRLNIHKYINEWSISQWIKWQHYLDSI